MAELPAPSAPLVDWLSRLFGALTRGPSLYEHAVFADVARVLNERLPHDALTMLVYDERARALRLVAHAFPTDALVPSYPEGTLLRAEPDALESMLGSTRVICDGLSASPSAFEAQFRARGIGSYAILAMSAEPSIARSWLVFSWRQPGRASALDAEMLTRTAIMVGAVAPSAEHHARARTLAAMLDRLEHGVVALDTAGVIIEANRAALAMFAGATAGAVIGQRFDALLTDGAQNALRDALGGGARGGPVLLRVRATGDAATLPIDAVITTVEGSAPVRSQVHLEDARARLANEAELRSRAEALAFLRDVAEAVAGELSTTTALARATKLVTQRADVPGAAIARVRASDGALLIEASNGVEPAALARFLALGAPADVRARSVAASAELRAAVGRAREPLVVPLHHADQLVGVALFVLAAGAPVATRELLVDCARTIAVAMHASIEYAEAVRLAFEHRQLLDSIPSIVFRLDPDTGATLYANAAVERVLGCTVADATGLPGLEGLILDAGERDAHAATRAIAAVGLESAWTDRRFRHRDGRTVILRTRLYAVLEPRDGGGESVVVEGVAQDVTDEIEARKQLIQADRLASLGMLAAGVAHEINNPTAFVSLGVQQLGRMVAQLSDVDPATGPLRRRMGEVLAELSDGVQRIVQIVGELKLFTRIPESAFSTPVDVNRLLISAVTLARAELRSRARLEIDLGDLPPLPGDHSRLGQVFVNLLINAAQAIPPGDADKNVVRVHTHASESEVHVEVSDTGVGIAPEHLSRIFDPFFTTKPPGEGTGLGLAISYDLVRRAGGTINVESTLGRGTRFRVSLPVRDYPLAHEGSRPRTPAPAPGARVLIVEDEQHLAVAIARALATTYMVELAPDGPSALTRIERTETPYDVVLCDLRLPGMDGRELYAAVHARWPVQAARFVFLTGAGLGGEYGGFVRTTDRPVLEKPFEMTELEEVVARVVTSAL